MAEAELSGCSGRRFVRVGDAAADGNAETSADGGTDSVTDGAKDGAIETGSFGAGNEGEDIWRRQKKNDKKESNDLLSDNQSCKAPMARMQFARTLPISYYLSFLLSMHILYIYITIYIGSCYPAWPRKFSVYCNVHFRLRTTSSMMRGAARQSRLDQPVAYCQPSAS